MLHERYERNLGCIGHTMKHRFTEKSAADCDTIKSAGEFARRTAGRVRPTGGLAARPRFDGMRVAELMQPGVALDDFAIDPGVFAFRARIDHVRKGIVDLDFEKVFPQGAAQRMWHMKIFQWNNRARIGREPPDGIVFHRHRKNTESIPFQQNIELNHDGEVKKVKTNKKLQREACNVPTI